MDKGLGPGADIGSQGLDEGRAGRRDEFAADVRSIIGNACQQFCRSRSRYGHNAVGAAYEAAADVERRRADLLYAQIFESPGNADDVQDAVDGPDFMEMNLVDRHAVNLCLGFCQLAEYGEAFRLNAVRQRRRFDNRRDFLQAAVLVMMVMARRIDEMLVAVRTVMFVMMMDSVFSVPPLYDDSYYGFPIHEIREMTVMNMGNYAHGNQPVQHLIYLYDYAKQPWKAQYWVRQVMDRMYTPTPDGYCGDEDNGQTSAWYVFSALGFYPVCPCTDQYAVGAPLFKKATLHFENGKTLVIDAPDNGIRNLYIESMKVNGQEYTKNYLTHSALQNGGSIEIVMGSEPNKARGISPEDAPYSFSKEVKD